MEEGRIKKSPPGWAGTGKLCKSANDAGVDVQILLGGIVPGEVGGHALLLDGAPGLLAAVVQVDGLTQHPQHVVGVHMGEGVAAAGALELVVGDDGVLQTAGLTHQRHGAEAHGTSQRLRLAVSWLDC